MKALMDLARKSGTSSELSQVTIEGQPFIGTSLDQEVRMAC
jgi:hypothetical protein